MDQLVQLVLRGCSQCSMDPPLRRKNLQPRIPQQHPYRLRIPQQHPYSLRIPTCPRSWTELMAAKNQC
jgi:hypothetical protein